MKRQLDGRENKCPALERGSTAGSLGGNEEGRTPTVNAGRAYHLQGGRIL